MEEAIYIKEQNDRLFIRAVGHITAAISATLRQKVIQRLSKEPILAGLFVDLSSCEYMDSTFMGLLLGINKRFEKLSGKKIELPRPSAQCIQLLETLGICGFFNINEDALVLPEGMESITSEGTASPEFLLKAHENLIEVSEENRKRFALLHDILKKKMEEKGESRD